jgi:uncharacterized RDD family membrane protein YckC
MTTPQDNTSAPDLQTSVIKPTPAASVWRRFMGVVYESLLLFGPLLLIGFVYSVLVDFSDKASPALYELKRFGMQATLFVALIAYFAWGWSKGRCTLPMQTLGMRLQTSDGRDVTVTRAALRAIAAIPSMLSGIGLLWAIVDRDSQTLHDRLCATRLVHIPVKRII